MCTCVCVFAEYSKRGLENIDNGIIIPYTGKAVCFVATVSNLHGANDGEPVPPDNNRQVLRN